MEYIAKKLVHCGVTVSAFMTMIAGPATAADLGPRVYRARVVPIASWTGLYVGIDTGGSIGVNDMTQSAVFGSPALGANGLLFSSGRNAITGWLFGGQVGYNYQISSLVVGLEADWQWNSQKNTTSNCSPPATLGFFGAGANAFGYCLTNEQKLTNFGTARARGGVLVHDSLWYVTGGVAWATVKDTDAFVGSANPVIFPAALQPGPFLPGAGSFSTNRPGWTIGAGVETQLFGGWSMKLEYLYVDLGSITETFGIPINLLFGPAFNTGGSASATTTSHITDNIVRVGLNYKFGSYAAPAVYK